MHKKVLAEERAIERRVVRFARQAEAWSALKPRAEEMESVRDAAKSLKAFCKRFARLTYARNVILDHFCRAGRARDLEDAARQLETLEETLAVVASGLERFLTDGARLRGGWETNPYLIEALDEIVSAYERGLGRSAGAGDCKPKDARRLYIGPLCDFTKTVLGSWQKKFGVSDDRLSRQIHRALNKRRRAA